MSCEQKEEYLGKHIRYSLEELEIIEQMRGSPPKVIADRLGLDPMQISRYLWRYPPEQIPSSQTWGTIKEFFADLDVSEGAIRVWLGREHPEWTLVFRKKTYVKRECVPAILAHWQRPDGEFLSFPEVSHLFSVPVSTLHNYLKAGKITAIQQNGNYFVPKDVIGAELIRIPKRSRSPRRKGEDSWKAVRVKRSPH